MSDALTKEKAQPGLRFKLFAQQNGYRKSEYLLLLCFGRHAPQGLNTSSTAGYQNVFPRHFLTDQLIN
jgi:hypothetical protein